VSTDSSTSVPEGDEIKRNKNNRGRGVRRLYTHTSKWDLLVQWTSAWKWPLMLLGALLIILLWWQGLPDISIPDPLKSFGIYMTVGSVLSALPSYLLLKRWLEPQGVEVWQIDPATGRHIHGRMGYRLWEAIELKSTWGGEATKEDLAECTINGRRGYELMDVRIKESGTPVAYVTAIGEMDSAALRTYRASLIYARKRLSRQAQKAQTLEANREHIIREIAERQVFQMIETSEQSGLPDGDCIHETVQDVLADVGIDDRLKDDDLDDLEDLVGLEDVEQWDPDNPVTQNGSNGNGDGRISKLLGGLNE